MFKLYKNRKEVDMGFGSGTRVTNRTTISGKENKTAVHSVDFQFMHAKFEGFNGTCLSWIDYYFFVDDEHINVKELNNYTDEQYFEIVLNHISAKGMMETIAEISKEANRQGSEEFKTNLRRMIME